MLENLELFGNSLGVGTYPDGEGKSFLQNIFDVIHPIGETYIQYPAQKTPQEIYNKKDSDRIIIDSVWEEQLQYNSAFFRSEHPNTYAYKAAGEEQYYDIDNNNNLTPIKVTGNNDIIVAGSPTSGQQKIVDGKTYQAYAITGINTSSNPYIIETNGLSKQGNCNKSHNHTTNGAKADLSINGAKADLSINSGGNSFSCTFRGSSENSSGTNRSIVFAVSGCSVSKGGDSGAAIDNLDSGTWDFWTFSYNGSHGHGITQNNHSHGITQNNHSHGINSDGEIESRPDNFTIRIWKRIS